MDIILASSSPRRRELLEKFNIDFDIITEEIEETIRDGETPEQIVMSLAFQKAYAVGKSYQDKIVLAADTIVSLDGKVLGKPKDEEDAFEMLKELSGKTHDVLTGIALTRVEDNSKIIDYERTQVSFRKLSDEKIRNYIKTGEAMGKAGGYGIQGYGGLLVEEIKGSYNNVVGLPITKLDILLEKHFNKSFI